MLVTAQAADIADENVKHLWLVKENMDPIFSLFRATPQENYLHLES